MKKWIALIIILVVIAVTILTGPWLLNIIGTVFAWIGKAFDWIGNAIMTVAKFLDFLNLYRIGG